MGHALRSVRLPASVAPCWRCSLLFSPRSHIPSASPSQSAGDVRRLSGIQRLDDDAHEDERKSRRREDLRIGCCPLPFLVKCPLRYTCIYAPERRRSITQSGLLTVYELEVAPWPDSDSCEDGDGAFVSAVFLLKNRRP